MIGLFGLAYLSVCQPTTVIDGSSLIISGEGVVTEDLVKSNGAYDSFDTVRIEDNVSEIGFGSFRGLESLKTVIMSSKSLYVIGDSSFRGCIHLSQLTFGPNILYIRNNCFYQCHSLADVSFPDCIREIGVCSFYDDKNITSIKLPRDLEILETEAFFNCKNLKQVIIGNKLEKLSSGVFKGTAIERVILPASLKSVNNNPVGVTVSLKFIQVDEKNELFSNDDQGILYDKDKIVIIQVPAGIENVTIIQSVTSISSSSFSSCRYVSNIVIPDNVKNLSSLSFQEMVNLRTVIVGSGIKVIPSQVFYTPLRLKMESKS